MNDTFTRQLWQSRASRSLVLPVKNKLYGFIDGLLGVLFPHFSDGAYTSEVELEAALDRLKRDLRQILAPLESRISGTIGQVCEDFFARVPGVYRALGNDAQAILDGDPAAESLDEVISAYPGFLAIATYRLAHELHMLSVPILPRMLTEYAHQKTGIDIHPGATIGESFFIDHGTGIVVGETTIIGNNVKLYQGVTLGALSVHKSLSKTKRHPTIEDNVVIYSNATILGGLTTVGHDSIIGGNVWLTGSVPPYSLVYQKSEVRVRDYRGKEAAVEFAVR